MTPTNESNRGQSTDGPTSVARTSSATTANQAGCGDDRPPRAGEPAGGQTGQQRQRRPPDTTSPDAHRAARHHRGEPEPAAATTAQRRDRNPAPRAHAGRPGRREVARPHARSVAAARLRLALRRRPRGRGGDHPNLLVCGGSRLAPRVVLAECGRRIGLRSPTRRRGVGPAADLLSHPRDGCGRSAVTPTVVPWRPRCPGPGARCATGRRSSTRWWRPASRGRRARAQRPVAAAFRASAGRRSRPTCCGRRDRPLLLRSRVPLPSWCWQRPGRRARGLGYSVVRPRCRVLPAVLTVAAWCDRLAASWWPWPSWSSSSPC